MVRLNQRPGRNVFWSILLLAIISCTLFSGTAFCEEPAETVLTQAEKDYAQAESFRKAKKFTEAIVLYQSVAQNSSDSELAMKGLTRAGRCETRLDNFTSADQLFEKLKNDHSTNPKLYEYIYYFGNTYSNVRNYKKARDIFQYIADNSSAVNLAFKGQVKVAYCEILLGNDTGVEQAVAVLKSNYFRHEELHTGLTSLAERYYRMKKFDNAKGIYQNIAQDSSDSSMKFKAVTGVGRCEIALGNHSAAEQVYEKLFADSGTIEGPCVEILEAAKAFSDGRKFDKAIALYQYVSRNTSDSNIAFNAEAEIAHCQVRSVNDAAAAVTLDKLKNVYPQHRELYAKISSLGDVYYKSNKYDKAKALYQSVAAGSLGSDAGFASRLGISNCAIVSGNGAGFDQAFSALVSEYSKHPKLHSNLVTLANLCWKRSKFDKAKIINQYVASNCSDLSLAINGKASVAACDVRLGNNAAADEVISELKSEYAQHPELTRYIYRLGSIYEGVRQPDKAKELYEYVSVIKSNVELTLEIQMQVVFAEIRLGDEGNGVGAFEVLCANFSGDKKFIDNVLAICNQFIRKNDPALALPYVNRALQATTDLKIAVRLLKLKAECYIDMGANEQAQAVQAEIALYAEQEYYPGVQLGIADRYRINGEHEKAIETYDKVLNSTTDNTQQLYAHAGIGMSFVWQGDDPNVTVIVDLLCKDFTGHKKLGWAVFVIGEEYYFKAQKKHRANGLDSAMEYYRKAIAVWARNIEIKVDERHFSESHYFTALTHRNIGEYDVAIEFFQMLLDKTPNFDRAWNAQFMIAYCWDKMCQNKKISTSDAKTLVLEACSKLNELYPDSRASVAAKQMADKYNKIK